jgi:hypothetical protein
MSDFIHSASKVFLSSNAANATSNGGSPSSYTFQIQPLIISNTDESQFVIGLESASIPLSFYVINTTNQSFRLDGITVVIARGNYTIYNLLTELNSKLLAYGFPSSTTFGYDANSNRLYISRASGSSTFTSVANDAREVLGYQYVSYANEQEFSEIVNLTYTTGITFRLDNLQTTNRDASSSGGSTSLARIPITTPAYTILQFFNNQPFYTTLKNKVINQISVSLIDDFGNLLNLNGTPNWFVTLRIDYKMPEELASGRTQIQGLRSQATQPYEEEQQRLLKEALTSADTAPPEYQTPFAPIKRITKPDYIQMAMERRLAKMEDMGMERPLVLQKKIRRKKK